MDLSIQAVSQCENDAAKITFHHLHKPGLVALLSDGIGFAMLFVIDIGAIRDLALVASVGVALVIFTNLVLLPILMSYVGVSQACISHLMPGTPAVPRGPRRGRATCPPCV